jgi:Protein phosphatase 2C
MTWQAIARSCAGTRHKKQGVCCQDYAKYKYIHNKHVIIGAVSDGAGFAKYADEGAKIAVQTAISGIEDWFNQDVNIPGYGWIFFNKPCLFNYRRATLAFEGVLNRVKFRLQQKARLKGCFLDDFTCTLLAFIATPNWMVAMQIGDGFIVVRQQPQKDYQLLFPPQKGEYVNQVKAFVTSDNAIQEMKVRFCGGSPKFICASTDALELASLYYGDWRPYNPFFDAFEQYMGSTMYPEKETEIETFLDSPEVNNTTEDDKTLLLCFYDR